MTMASGSIPSRDIDWASTKPAMTALIATMPGASRKSTAAVTRAIGLRATSATPAFACYRQYDRQREGYWPVNLRTRVRTRAGVAGRSAKNPRAIRRDPTKKPEWRLAGRTETCATPRSYCAVKEPCVPWCDKGIHDPSRPGVTLRVGKLTTGDGSKGRVGSP